MRIKNLILSVKITDPVICLNNDFNWTQQISGTLH
jgi:hypothetical protein